MLRPILAVDDLPEVGAATTEHLTCDFKVKAAGSRFEMAKDVAAFANCYGGTILLGAAEAIGAFGKYVPMDLASASIARREYEQAVRGRCNPAPLVSVDTIPYGGEQEVVVAVNVSPAIATPVGVRVKGDVADGFGESAYASPMRVTTQTIYLQPGQLSVLMLPKTRLAVVLLSRFRGGDRLTLQYLRAQHGGVYFEDAIFESVDPLLNRVRLKLGGLDRNMPLDAIESIWEDAHGVIACVSRNHVKDKVHNYRWIFIRP